MIPCDLGDDPPPRPCPQVRSVSVREHHATVTFSTPASAQATIAAATSTEGLSLGGSRLKIEELRSHAERFGTAGRAEVACSARPLSRPTSASRRAVVFIPEISSLFLPRNMQTRNRVARQVDYY